MKKDLSPPCTLETLNHGDGCAYDCLCRITSDYVLPDVAVLGNSGTVRFDKILTCCDMKLPSCKHHFTLKRYAVDIQNKIQLLDYIQDKIKNHLEQIDGFLNDMNATIHEINALVENCNEKRKNN